MNRRREADVLPFPQAPEAVEVRHLRSFVAVAEELNFTRAAERLHLSRPALSRQIAHLERLVGVQLLHRTTHVVELTVAGEALLERARELLDGIDAAIRTTQAVGGRLVGRVARLWDPIVDRFAAQAGVEATRAAYEAMHAQFGPPDGIATTPVVAGGVSSLVLAGDGDPPLATLFVHGGAHVLGSAFGFRHLAGALAAATGSAVLVPDYRLAPEHPFPADLDDVRERSSGCWTTGPIPRRPRSSPSPPARFSRSGSCSPVATPGSRCPAAWCCCARGWTSPGRTPTPRRTSSARRSTCASGPTSTSTATPSTTRCSTPRAPTCTACRRCCSRPPPATASSRRRSTWSSRRRQPACTPIWSSTRPRSTASRCSGRSCPRPADAIARAAHFCGTGEPLPGDGRARRARP